MYIAIPVARRCAASHVARSRGVIPFHQRAGSTFKPRYPLGRDPQRPRLDRLLPRQQPDAERQEEEEKEHCESHLHASQNAMSMMPQPAPMSTHKSKSVSVPACPRINDLIE
ncbi:MAG: hypothetical protein WCF84_02230 [Anaerolineae bacterium]